LDRLAHGMDPLRAAAYAGCGAAQNEVVGSARSRDALAQDLQTYVATPIAALPAYGTKRRPRSGIDRHAAALRGPFHVRAGRCSRAYRGQPRRGNQSSGCVDAGLAAPLDCRAALLAMDREG